MRKEPFLFLFKEKRSNKMQRTQRTARDIAENGQSTLKGGRVVLTLRCDRTPWGRRCTPSCGGFCVFWLVPHWYSQNVSQCREWPGNSQEWPGHCLKVSKKHSVGHEWGRHDIFLHFEKGVRHEIARSSDLDYSRDPTSPNSCFVIGFLPTPCLEL